MNVDELVESHLYPLLDWNPVLRANKDNIVQAINRYYLPISDSAPWLFLQRVVTLTVRPTVTGSATATVQIATTNLRRVLGTGTSFQAYMEGQEFLVTGTTFVKGKLSKLVTEVTTTTVATIAWVESTTSMYLMEEASAAVAAGTRTWSVRFPRYAMPMDCAEVLSIMSRADDRGKLAFLDKRGEAHTNLDPDDTGDPEIAIEDDHHNLRSPDPTPTLTTAAAGGDFPAATYEVCYTLLEAGREGPPSLVASIATTGTTSTITVSNLEDHRWADSTPTRYRSGTRVAIYVREQTEGGRWRRYATMNDTNASPSLAKGTVTLLKLLPDEVDVSTNESVVGSVLTGATYNYSTRDDQEALIESNPRPYLRFYYTASAALALELRYRASPRRLSHNADVPLWPPAYHVLLVYLVMTDLCMTYGQTTAAQVYQRRADDLLKQMRSKYLSREDRVYVRQGFDAGSRIWRYGNPIKTDA